MHNILKSYLSFSKRHTCKIINFLSMSQESFASYKFLITSKNINTMCISSAFKYHSDIEKEINEQINREHKAGFTYLTFASYFGHVNVSRKGCYKFFMKMYREELEHANEFIQYQLLRGGTVHLNVIKPYQMQEKSMHDFFESALKMELEITEKIQNIIKISQKHNDNHSSDYITNKFLKEQINSMSELGSLISILRDVGNMETGLYIFDLELEKRC